MTPSYQYWIKFSNFRWLTVEKLTSLYFIPPQLFAGMIALSILGTWFFIEVIVPEISVKRPRNTTWSKRGIHPSRLNFALTAIDFQDILTFCRRKSPLDNRVPSSYQRLAYPVFPTRICEGGLQLRVKYNHWPQYRRNRSSPVMVTMSTM